QAIRRDQRVVGHGDHALARIAVWPAERIQLLEEHAGDARLLRELAARGILEALADPHEPAGQRPLAAERVAAAPDQQQFQPRVSDREDREIHRDGGVRMLVAVFRQGRVLGAPATVYDPHEVYAAAPHRTAAV